MGFRQIVIWAYKRWSNKDRIKAEIDKIKAETKSIEIESLSSTIEQLYEQATRQELRIVALEDKVQRLQESEGDCLKKLRDCQDREMRRMFGPNGGV